MPLGVDLLEMKEILHKRALLTSKHYVTRLLEINTMPPTLDKKYTYVIHLAKCP